MAGSINRSHKAFLTVGLALATLACLVGLLAQPAAAQTDGDDDGARVVITGRVDVGAQERTDSVVIFHGPAVDGILDNATYRRRFGVDNPNLEILSALKRAGVEILVCGQFLGAMGIDTGTLSPDASVAAEAFLTLITYQNNGYAVLEF